MKDYTQNLGYAIKRYTALANQSVEEVLRPYGIGRTQWYILFHIQAAGTLPQRRLQTLLEIESATLTSLIAALVKKDLIQQQPHTADKRSKQLVLTERGQRLWDSMPDPIDVVKTKALRGISAKAIADARKVIDQAISNLERKDT